MSSISLTSTATATVKLSTWNSQGNFRTDADKSAHVKWIFDTHGIGCCFIQEGGLPGTNTGGGPGYGRWNDPSSVLNGFYYAHGATPGAKNQRCTNWIVCRSGGAPWVSDTVGGGEAGRQAVGYVDGSSGSKILFASWHSVSADRNDDTGKLIDECLAQLAAEKYDRVIIGGDFNSRPDSIRALILRRWRAKRNRKCNWYFDLYVPSAPTHQSGRTLDFYVDIWRTDDTPNLDDDAERLIAEAAEASSAADDAVNRARRARSQFTKLDRDYRRVRLHLRRAEGQIGRLKYLGFAPRSPGMVLARLRRQRSLMDAVRIRGVLPDARLAWRRTQADRDASVTYAMEIAEDAAIPTAGGTRRAHQLAVLRRTSAGGEILSDHFPVLSAIGALSQRSSNSYVSAALARMT